MLLRTGRFVTLMLSALSAGMAFCHLMEMPARLRYAPALWSRITNAEGTYRLFGPPVGASIEGGALISALALSFFARKRRFALAPTLVGACCLAVAQLAWWLFVFPANSRMADWTPESLPEDFTEVRDRWEYTHAARAVLQIVGLGSLVLSILAEPSGEYEG
ncbi:hypothetical protein Rxycam_03090 [Rubrobacter xylanophilus DSM 9941]|uniref:anthrone oxygenase family protein n=1 Tax=Rubrobacter xylanophilus TaxID=49319 RepID=UPI001C63FFAD|nr:DUF1772 domain-containing protein [Rubrobacter xylanophilus]QYJ17248.1 hypothetical protein Rxycam_03090 [Rubrobacter xylanophilus DSM 9941]